MRMTRRNRFEGLYNEQQAMNDRLEKSNVWPQFGH